MTKTRLRHRCQDCPNWTLAADAYIALAKATKVRRRPALSRLLWSGYQHRLAADPRPPVRTFTDCSDSPTSWTLHLVRTRRLRCADHLMNPPTPVPVDALQVLSVVDSSRHVCGRRAVEAWIGAGRIVGGGAAVSGCVVGAGWGVGDRGRSSGWGVATDGAQLVGRVPGQRSGRVGQPVASAGVVSASGRAGGGGPV
jgi:hypothetical protein